MKRAPVSDVIQLHSLHLFQEQNTYSGSFCSGSSFLPLGSHFLWSLSFSANVVLNSWSCFSHGNAEVKHHCRIKEKPRWKSKFWQHESVAMEKEFQQYYLQVFWMILLFMKTLSLQSLVVQCQDCSKYSLSFMYRTVQTVLVLSLLVRWLS